MRKIEESEDEMCSRLDNRLRGKEQDMILLAL